MYGSYMFRHYVATLWERFQCLLRDAQLNISQKALRKLPEFVNIMPKHVGVPYIINKLNV
jgi:hypothetical protein